MSLSDLRALRGNYQPGICSIGEGDVGAGAGGDGGGSGTGDGGSGASGAGAGGTPWFSTFDAETQGVLQTKGWDKLTPDQAALAAIGSYREAEKFLGVPKDQLLRRPDPNDPASVAAFYQQLGKPPAKDGYDFAAVKFADGTELDPAFVNHMRDLADSLNLPKDTASQVAAGIVKFMEQADAASVGENTAALTAQMDALKKNWGTQFDAHKFLANQGALKVGVSQAEFDQMFNTPGGPKMLEIFHKIGELGGEGRFVANAGGGNGVLTREQAVSEKAQLMNDSAWVAKYNNGDQEAYRRMSALNTIIVGNATEDDLF